MGMGQLNFLSLIELSIAAGVPLAKYLWFQQTDRVATSVLDSCAKGHSSVSWQLKAQPQDCGIQMLRNLGESLHLGQRGSTPPSGDTVTAGLKC